MSRFLYLLLLIAAAVFYPLYEDNLSYILLIAVILLPLLMGAELVASALLLRCSPHRGDIIINKDGGGEVQIDLFNRSVFPLSRVRVMARVCHSPSGASEDIFADIPLPARSFRTVTVNISPECCGETTVTLEYVRVTDLLRLFSVKLFRDTGLFARVYAIPKLSDKYASAAEEMVKRLYDTAADEGDADSGAFGDPAGYREYRPGDRLSRINHKLSARFDKDMVRIMSASRSGRFLLTADLSAAPGKDGDIKEALRLRDSRLEKLISLSHYLALEGGEVYIAVPGLTLPECELINGVCAVRLGTDRTAVYKALAGADTGGTLPRESDEYTTVRIDRTEDYNEKDQ